MQIGENEEGDSAYSEPNTVEEYFDLLQEVEDLDVHLVNVRKDYKAIQINTPNPWKTRKELVTDIGPMYGIDFI